MKKPLIVIFLTVFLYLLGFGMIIPVLPLLSTHYGASAFQAGLLMSCYSLMQFLFSPFWGRLSDKFGRRPILMYCLLGEAVSYLILASARSLEMLFVARILTGFFAASISTASAYVSDVTSPQERSKGMALIGAAFGMGFLFGPALGGGLTIYAETISSDPGFIASFSSYGVAVLCLFTFVFAYFKLTESLNLNGQNKTTTHTAEKKNRLQTLTKYLRSETVSPLIIIFALATLGMAMMESTLVLFMSSVFNWGIKEVSFGFAYIGFIIVFTQGFLVRKLLPRFGEKILLATGISLMSVGFLFIALAPNITIMAVAMTLLSLGNGLSNPSVMGSISLLVPENEQGLALGTTQSLSALGRVIGPALGGFLFNHFTKNLPFLLSSALTALAVVIIFILFKKLPSAGKKTAEYNTGYKTETGYINKIGFYQFDNLVQGRIPFMFLNLSTDVSSWYNSIYKLHIETYQVCLKEADIEQELKTRQIPLDFAILVLCDDGQKSEKIAQNLHKKGYTNVYMINGGYQQMMTERKNI